MVFSSIEFLFYFLPVTLAVYFISPKPLKNAVLLVASLIFYTWGGGIFVLILLVSIVIDYFVGFLVAWARDNDRPGYKTLGVLISVVLNVGLLVYFKYAGFFVDQVNGLSESLGWPELAWTGVALPIGISFFTFQSMSYTIDVARGTSNHLTNPIDFGLYVAFFPQLIAGPIVRFHEINEQLPDHPSSVGKFAEGAVRFSHGLVKKVVFADAAGAVADAAFGLSGESVTWSVAWIGTLAFTLQIYYDFSGYSDMAIGLARMVGFRLPENFRRPYSAISITDFWRRWHITLSNWFRDYVYVPLGGSRGSSAQTYRNLIIVFLLTGLWHGAAWTFVIWGAFHGTLLIIERVTGRRPVGDGPVSYEWQRRVWVLLAVMIGWVMFRADTLSQALEFYQAMFTSFGGALDPALEMALTNRNLLLMALASVVFVLPRNYVGGIAIMYRAGWRPATARIALLAFALPYAVVLIAAGSFSPFLYFRF